jgi:hypothetical protein
MCDESAGWMPDADDIRKKVTGKTKAILIKLVYNVFSSAQNFSTIRLMKCNPKS